MTQPLRPLTPSYLHWRAWKIHNKIAADGALQVRWHDGQFLTFKYPAPHGYGVRGQLVGVYAPGATIAWIEDDLAAFAITIDGESKRCAVINA